MDANVTALQPGTPLVDASTDAVQVVRPETPLQRLQALPPRQKWMLGGGLVGLLVVVVALALLNRQDKYAPLFVGAVSEKDAGAAVAQLKLLEVPYKISDGNQVILVPADKAGELRMRMASAGLPKGSVTGFELLDNPRFGMSQQQERTSLQRALEGELTRSVGSLAALEAARVHLAMPQPNGFFREQVKPSASVMVTLRPGHLLDRSQIAGIVHLVSSSVPDLSPKAVSVIDQEGNLLSQRPDGDARQDLTEQQRKHVSDLEKSLLKRVNEILEPALGRGNLRATVAADVDFNQVETTSEAFRPNQTPDAAAVRSQRNIEQGGPGQVQPAGVPGAANNQPPQLATAPVTGASQPPLQGAQAGLAGGGNRKESQVNYEVDRKVELTRNAVGNLRRVNVAVVVNHRNVTDAKGKTAPQPLPPDELEKLTSLVQEAVGYNKERGDSVKVVNMVFREELNPKPEELPAWRQPWVLDLVKTAGVPLVLLLVALSLVFGVIRPALKKDEPEPVAQPLDAVVDGPEALPGPDGSTALIAPDEEISPHMVEQLEDARLLARENPLAVANILRTWVHGEASA
jgi:flagellar M-ring protein FliF